MCESNLLLTCWDRGCWNALKTRWTSEEGGDCGTAGADLVFVVALSVFDIAARYIALYYVVGNHLFLNRYDRRVEDFSAHY